MRCMAIASALKEKDYNCIFIMADKEAKTFVESKGFQVLCLDSVWNKMDTETDKLVKLIREREIDRLLIDSYFVTDDYLKKIGKLTKVYYIDDLDKFIYPVHTLINYSIYADKFHYEERYMAAGMDTKFLLGSKYTPLRKEFSEISFSVREQVSDILITTGGTDNYNIAGHLIENLLDTPLLHSITMHVVVGAYNKHKDYLYQLQKENDKICIHENVTEMAKLMVSCDIAISAGGTTLYELSACGVPTITFSIADNQLDNVRRFSEEELMIYAGDVRDGMVRICDNIRKSVRMLVSDSMARKKFSDKMKAMDVCNGCRNIIDELMSEDDFKLIHRQ